MPKTEEKTSLFVQRMKASFDPKTHGNTIPGWLIELAKKIEQVQEAHDILFERVETMERETQILKKRVEKLERKT